MAIRIFLFLSCIILNTGCGFRPLYNTNGLDHNNVPDIQIDRIPDRNGQIVRNRLLQLLSTHVNETSDTSIIVSPIVIATNSTSVRRDGTTSRYRLTVSATVKIINNITKKVLFENNVMAINAYSIGEYSATAAYSTLTAAQDAKDKALHDLADQINVIIITYYQNLEN